MRLQVGKVEKSLQKARFQLEKCGPPAEMGMAAKLS